MNWLSSPTIKVLERGLDMASFRHQLLAHNIANVDTPGFKRSGTDFAQAMSEAMNAADRDERINAAPRVVTEADTSVRNDGNNVDIEREMAEMAENNLLYNAMSQLLSKRYAQLRTVINEGRR